MASIVLSTIGVPYLGTQIGSIASNVIDGRKTTRHHYEGARLEDLAVQTSTYGRMISEIFGRVRIAGNVIWSRPIKEVATTTTVSSGGGGKGGGGSRAKQTTTQTSYHYYVTLAIAIGQGPITRLERVWADSKLLDLSLGTYRIYLGTEEQMPDPMMLMGVVSAASLMPLSPVHALRDSSGNATIRWTRRARHGGEWRAEVDVPLMEASEQYDVEIIQAENVVRSWRVGAPEQLYTATEQTTDLGGVASSITVRISQLSALVGKGAVTETVV